MPLDVVVIDIRALHLREPIEKRLIVGFIFPLADRVPFILAVISVPIAFFILDSDALTFSKMLSDTPVWVVKFVASLPRPFISRFLKGQSKMIPFSHFWTSLSGNIWHCRCHNDCWWMQGYRHWQRMLPQHLTSWLWPLGQHSTSRFDNGPNQSDYTSFRGVSHMDRTFHSHHFCDVCYRLW